MNDKVLLVGPGGDSCGGVRSCISEELGNGGIGVTSVSPLEIVGTQDVQVAIAHDPTYFRGGMIEGTIKVAKMVRAELDRIVPVVVISIATGKAIVIGMEDEASQYFGESELIHALRFAQERAAH